MYLSVDLISLSIYLSIYLSEYLSIYLYLSICRSGQKIIYAWAKNAPKLDLPKGVGFKVGGPRADVQYLVLQVGQVPCTTGRVSTLYYR